MTQSYIVLKRFRLAAEHQPTGKTRHSQGGVPIPPPRELLIVRYADDPGFYLIHLDEAGQELTDTYHESVGEAQAQADWEFRIAGGEWEDVG